MYPPPGTLDPPQVFTIRAAKLDRRSRRPRPAAPSHHAPCLAARPLGRPSLVYRRPDRARSFGPARGRAVVVAAGRIGAVGADGTGRATCRQTAGRGYARVDRPLVHGPVLLAA